MKTGSQGGLFYLNSGTIKNLNVIISDEGMTGTGGISSTNHGTISNCVVKGNMTGNHNYMGGICSSNYNSISNCKFEGSIESTYSSPYVGGITGYNGSSASIFKCVSKSTLTSKKYVGGMCGYNNNDISDCYFIGSLNGSASYKGGIVGYNYYYSSSRYSKITDCYAAACRSKVQHRLQRVQSYRCCRHP